MDLVKWKWKEDMQIIQSHRFVENGWGKMETVTDYIFLGSKITVDVDWSHEIKRGLLLGIKAMTNLDSILKNRDITLLTKVHISQNYGFSSSHVWMWELDLKEGWVKNWCFWTVVLEKTLESSLDCKEIKLINPKGNQSWIFFGRTDAEGESPILWPLDVKNQLTGKDSDVGKIEGRKRRGNRGWYGWKASLTQWTWIWGSFRRRWRTGKPGMLQSMGSQRVGHDWATEQQQKPEQRCHQRYLQRLQASCVVAETQGLEIQVPASLYGPANLCTPKIYFSVFM